MRVAAGAVVLAVALSAFGCGVRVSLGYDDDGSSDGGTSSPFDADIDSPLLPDAAFDDVEVDTAPDEDVIEEFVDAPLDASVD